MLALKSCSHPNHVACHSWYGVKTLCVACPERSDEVVLGEERVILVNSCSFESASLLATDLTIKYLEEVNADKTFTVGGNRCSWKFHKVLDVYNIFDGDISSGSEVYSIIIESDKVNCLLRYYDEKLVNWSAATMVVLLTVGFFVGFLVSLLTIFAR